MNGQWMAVILLAIIGAFGYAWSQDRVRIMVAVKMAEWSLRLGGASVLDYYDRVRLMNTPAYGHRVYTSPDGRVLVIDPIEPTAETFTAEAGAVEIPKRCVLQITSYGQPPSRAELSHVEAVRLGTMVLGYLANGPVQSAGGPVLHSQR